VNGWRRGDGGIKKARGDGRVSRERELVKKKVKMEV
jgi:hypothetical protein